MVGHQRVHTPHRMTAGVQGRAGPPDQDGHAVSVNLLGFGEGVRRQPEEISKPAPVGGHGVGRVPDVVGEVETAVRTAADPSEAGCERGADESGAFERSRGDEGADQTIRSRTTALA